MILLLVAILCLCLFGFFLHEKDEYSFLGFAGFMLCIVGGIGLVMYCVLFFSYVSAGHKAKIINREFGTNYTQEEVFYAEDVIDAIAEVKRTRVELNGDLMGKK